MSSTPLTRADALRVLIERMEAGDAWLADMVPTLGGAMVSDIASARDGGSLDAVARLEAPLRERGWIGPSVAPQFGDWSVVWLKPESFNKDNVSVLAPEEAPARLLGVLEVHLWEEEHPHD